MDDNEVEEDGKMTKSELNMSFRVKGIELDNFSIILDVISSEELYRRKENDMKKTGVAILLAYMDKGKLM